MPTIHDVARRAGVSPVTVSRVINDAPNVNAETRARVEAVVRELNYLPNLAARSLRARATHTLALLVPDVTNPFWTTVARGVEDAAQAEGYAVLLCNTDEDPAKQDGYLELVLKRRVDGVIIAPCDADPARLACLHEQDTPAVLVDRSVPGWDGDMVSCDSLAAARELTRHLLRLGRKRLAVISGPAGASTAEDRLAGVVQALGEAGLVLDQRLVRRGAYRAEAGRAMTLALLDEGLRPDAVLAANNALAFGVMEALAERGVRVPQDIALVCFDELPDLARFFPFLTVAAQPAYDIGLNAAQLLLSRMQAEGPLQPRLVQLPVQLTLRYSCGRLPLPGGSALLDDRSETHLLLPELQSPQPEAALKQALRGGGGGPVVLELDFPGRVVLEYVLQRSLGREVTAATVDPADWSTYAARAGVDALGCQLSLVEGASPAAALNRLEDFLRAAQPLGLGVVPVVSLDASGVKRLVSLCRRFSSQLELVILEDGSALDDRLLTRVAAVLHEYGLLVGLRPRAPQAERLPAWKAAGVDVLVGCDWPENLALAFQQQGGALVGGLDSTVAVRAQAMPVGWPGRAETYLERIRSVQK